MTSTSIGSRTDPLFWLRPLNEKAELAVSSAKEGTSTSFVDGTLCLAIRGRHHTSDTSHISLGVLGRNGTLKLPSSGIETIQCEFLQNTNTKLVLLRDRSSGSTSLSGTTTGRSLPTTNQRQIVLLPNESLVIGMGGARKSTLLFQVVWNDSHEDVVSALEQITPQTPTQTPSPSTSISQEVDSELSDSYLMEDWSTPSTDSHAQLGSQQNYLSHRPQDVPQIERLQVWLGSGSFGAVYKGVNITTGSFVAVKTISRPERNTNSTFTEKSWDSMLREIGILARLEHPNIVEYLGHITRPDLREIDLYMELETSPVESLFRTPPADTEALVLKLLIQMLRALEHTHSRKLLHRDIKPANILYRLDSGEFVFKLADFGLGNRINMAATLVGTPLFMPPELLLHGSYFPKSDIWSLFVTILWILNLDGFRVRLQKASGLSRIRVVEQASNHPIVARFRQMGAIKPQDRPTAAETLAQLGAATQ